MGTGRKQTRNKLSFRGNTNVIRKIRDINDASDTIAKNKTNKNFEIGKIYKENNAKQKKYLRRYVHMKNARQKYRYINNKKMMQREKNGTRNEAVINTISMMYIKKETEENVVKESERN